MWKDRTATSCRPFRALETPKENKINSTAGAEQVEAKLQEQHSGRLNFCILENKMFLKYLAHKVMSQIRWQVPKSISSDAFLRQL